MKTDIFTGNGRTAVVIFSRDVIISDVQSALDLIMNIKYQYNTDRVAVNKEAVCNDFFIISTGLAGEILQKFINYQVKFAVYGDYSVYTSKPLHDFIYESNNGKDIFFPEAAEKAAEKLLSL